MATGRMPSSVAPALPGLTPQPVATTSAIPGKTGRMPVDSGAVTAGRMPVQSEPIPHTPWGFISGFATNVAKGVVDTVKGIGQLLLVAPTHDIAQGIQHIIPGQQMLESEPSMLGTIARTALPGVWVPGPDLGGKWGAIASDYAHRYGSPSNLAKGLYENPISYVMDALMLADGIGLIGKSGRVGALAGMPELVGDATAARILGPALKQVDEFGQVPSIAALTAREGTDFAPLARYGETPYASFSRAAGKYEGVGLSKNFIVRAAQQGIYKALSRTPEATGTALEAAGGATARQSEVIADAIAWNNARTATLAKAADADALWSQPMRILKETPGQLIAKHSESKVLSALRIRLQTQYQGAVNELRPHIKAQDIDEVTGELRPVAEDLPFLYDQGLDAPDNLPNTDPYQINVETSQPISTTEASNLKGELAPFKEETAVRMSRRYGNQGLDKANAEERLGFVSYETPFAGKGGRGGQESYKVLVSELDDAERAGTEALQVAGYDKEVKLAETVSDAQHPAEGIWMYGKNEAGETMAVSVGTREMLEAQSHNDFVFRHLDDLMASEEATLAKLEKMPDRERVIAADELKLNIIEQKAAREYLKNEQFYHARASHWEDKINPATGERYGYNPELKQAMSTRPWRSKNIVARWIAENKSVEKYPFTRMMERKFTLARSERLTQVLGELQPEIAKIAERPALPRIGEAQKYIDLQKMMKKFGIPDDIIQNVLRGENGAPVASTKTLVNRLRNELWDYTVREGGAGASYDFAPWDWRTMQDEMVAAGKPVPSYMPNLPRAKPSSYAMKGGVETGKGLFVKDWNQELFESGQLKDVSLADAMVRAARVTTTHDEMRSFMNKMIDEFGRDATPEEATAWLKYGDARYTGEYFFDPDAALNLVDLRGQLISQTILNVPESKDVMEATAKALEKWSNDVAESGLNAMANSKIKSIPEHIAKMIQDETKYQFGTGMKLFWDTPMKVWKASVLSLSPRWVVNNLFGNLMFVGLENPSALRHVIAQFDGKNRALAEALLGVDVIGEVESGFWHEMENVRGGLEWEASVEGKPILSKVKEGMMGGGISPRRSAWENIKSPATEDPSTWAKLNVPSRTLQTWSRGVRNFNSEIEEAFRRGILVDELSRGRLRSFGTGLESSTRTLQDLAKEGVTPKGYELALNRVDRVIGNFTRYSPIEQNVVRRFFMPFYGFYRHMVNVLLKLPIEHPLKGSIFQQIAHMDNIMKDGIPSYMQDASPLHIGQIFGGDTWLRLNNMNPLSQATEEFGLVNLFNPALKMAIERGLGVNTFTGEPFDPETLGQTDIVQAQNGEFFHVIRDEDGNVMDAERTGRPLPSMLQHMASQLGLVSMLPSFSLYPKSVQRNVLSWAGLSTSQPARGTADALQYDAEMRADAMSQGMATGPDPFGGFGSFGSF